MLYLIFATLIVVVLFQIIILINQRKNGKLVGDFIAQRNSRNFQSDRGGDRPDRFRDRNTNGNRPNRPPRTEQESRPRPQVAPAAPVAPDGAVDNMEKSLRDINLKLKNAEHDQEVARRKFQDNGAGSGNRDENRGSRDGGNRGGRDGGRGSRDGSRGSRDGSRGGRDDNRGGRDENRDHRRGGGDRDRNRNNWRDRNQDRPFQEDQVAESADVEVQEAVLPFVDTGAISAPVMPPAAPELAASDFSTDNTEHGRKIQVKRRQLPDDQPGEDASSNSSNAASDTMDTSSEKPANDAEISFGRR